MSQLANSGVKIPFIEEKINEIEGHPAWNAEADLSTSEALLKGHKPFTYLLRSAEKEHHYLLSFVDEDLLVQHRPISIRFSVESRGWYFLNSQSHTRNKLSDLIPIAMHCDPSICSPLLRS